MSSVLYIAAKAPRVGVAKTRLGRAIGHEYAVTLYTAFLRDIAARFARAPFPVGWYVTPPDAWPDLARVVGGTGAGRVIVQAAGDWGERQRALFAGAAARGEERVILVASDVPQLPVDVVTEAFDALNRHDLVLGPGFDGGYYLIGMRGWHDVLRNVPMSTSTVLRVILSQARRAGLSVAQLAAAYDVDEVHDLEALYPLAERRADLASTRAALHELGLLAHSATAAVAPA